eukprot:scaffold143_cov173-Ochromonas_danica.AAC.13
MKRMDWLRWYRSCIIIIVLAILMPNQNGLVIKQRLNGKPGGSDRTTSCHQMIATRKASSATAAGTFEKQLRALISSKKWDEAKNVLSSLETIPTFSTPSARMSTGRSLAYIICETCRKTNAIEQILPMLLLVQDKIECTEGDIMTVILECAEKRRMRKVEPILSFLKRRYSLKLSAKLASVLIRGYGLSKLEGLVDRTFQECMADQTKIDIILLNSGMDAYIRCGNFPKAIEIFQTMTVNENASSLMSVDDHKYIAKDIWQFLKIQSVVPDVQTFNVLLKGFRGRDGEGSLKRCFVVLEMMRMAGIKPNTVTFNTLVDACVVNNKMNMAVELLKNNEVDVAAFTSVISGLCAAGDVKGSFAMFELMKQRSIAPNIYTLVSLMSACMREGLIGKARALLQVDNFTPAWPAQISELRSTYIIGLCQLHLSTDNRRVFSGRYFWEALLELVKMHTHGLPPTAISHNAVMRCLCSEPLNRVKLASILMKSMIAEGLLPDDYTYSILFTGLGRAGYALEALDLYRDVSTTSTVGMVVTNALFSALLNSNHFVPFIHLFIELAGNSSNSSTNFNNFAPDVVTFTTLVNAFRKHTRVPNERFDADYENPPIVSTKQPTRPTAAIESMKMELLTLLKQNNNTAPLFLSYQTIVKDLLTIQDPSELLAERPNRQSSQDVLEDEDKVFKTVYSILRFKYKVIPDGYVVTALNKLFERYLVAPSFLPSFSPSDKNGIKRSTARFVLEDLILLGIHPREMSNIMKYCNLSPKEAQDYQNEDYLQRLRSSAASLRIFRKHGWNDVNSGWSPL